MDRNFDFQIHVPPNTGSLSARRAWIEIRMTWPGLPHRNVALRKESVDRNGELREEALKMERSLSARRAWIEIA